MLGCSDKCLAALVRTEPFKASFTITHECFAEKTIFQGRDKEPDVKVRWLKGFLFITFIKPFLKFGFTTSH